MSAVLYSTDSINSHQESPFVKRNASVAVLAVFLSSFVYAQQAQPTSTETKKKPTIEAVYAAADASAAEPEHLQWSPDGSKITFVQEDASGEGQSLWYFDPATGKSASLVASDKMAAMNPPASATGNKGDDRLRDNRARYGVAAYHWAPNSNGILFDNLGRLWYFDLKSEKATPVTNGEPSGDPKFSPDGRYVSFVRRHNLFVKPVSGGHETALTKDTDENLLNGEVDWVYLEELDVRSNYFWSPDSRQILFLQMNEAPVPQYPVVDWMTTHPAVDMMRYPKAGDPNPTVRLGVVDLNGRTKWLPVTQESDIYIPRFGWVRPGLAWAMVLNRQQNRQDLYFIDTATGRSRLVLQEKDDAYIELTDTVRFLKSADRFIWGSWRDGYTHLYLYSFDKNNPVGADAKLERQLTKGEFEVTEVRSVDEQNGVVYLSANKDDDREMQLYAVKLEGGELSRVTQEKGSHDPEMAPNSRYFVDKFSSVTTQPVMQICGVSGPCNQIWRSTAMDSFELIAPQFVDFKAEDGTVLHGILLLPPAGAPGAKNGKIPLIMNPYGGPHGQSAKNASTAMAGFDQVLAQHGFAVLKVDNRGMGNRGRKFATVTYKNLGDIEFRDQMAALEQALQQFPQLDGSRVGFWGWSYGGAMTLNMMTRSDRFKVGVSVAPVTDWRNYDTIYTERYMGLPKDNPAGYDRASFLNKAAALKGNLMIVHGTSDDNVHMQNTLQFVNELINHGKQFCLQMYPQKTHSISGAKARTHLYTRILMQFENQLMK